MPTAADLAAADDDVVVVERNNEQSFLTISSDYRKKLSWCRTGAGCMPQLSSHISAMSASPGLGA